MNDQTNIQTNVAVMQTGKDALTAVFIISVLLNASLFIGWLLVSIDPSFGTTIPTL